MRININKTHLIFTCMFIFLVLSFIGPAYSWFSYNKDIALNLGTIDVENTVSGTTNINLTNLKSERIKAARKETDNYIDFTLTSKNNYQSTNMYYYIKLHYRPDISGKTRISDNLLVFDLEKTVGGTTTKVIDSDRIPNADGLIIYKDTLAPQTNSKVINFRLRIWVKDGETNITNKYANFGIELTPVYFDPIVNAFISFYDETPNAQEMLIDNALPSNEPTLYVTNANGINYGLISSDTNGKGLYILRGTESDDYPIAFFRGEVNNNNVIFGGFCWQIVRTTDTGGIKMIYNGAATGGGTTCANTAHADRIISTSTYNSSNRSIADVGYMYNTIYSYSPSSWTANALFGTSASWNGSSYSLTGANVTTPDATHHYSCNETSASATCTSVRYVYYVNGSTNNFITLTNGALVEDALYRMTGTGTSTVISRNSGYVLNNTSSTIKTNLETWFSNNLNSYINYLEDTTWCSDRTFKTSGSNSLSSSGWNPSGGSLSTYPYFGVRNRLNGNNWFSTTNVPVMTCTNETDQFRVNNSKAHLNYPIGLLTADEVVLGGATGNELVSNSTFYLNTGGDYWTMIPTLFAASSANMLVVDSSGRLNGSLVSSTNGLRGVISLKFGTQFISGGDGTPTNPYVVKMN